LAQVAYLSSNQKLIEYEAYFKAAIDQISKTVRSSIISGWLHSILKYGSPKIKNDTALRKVLSTKLSKEEKFSKRIIGWKADIDKWLYHSNTVGFDLLNKAITIEEYLKGKRLSRELIQSQFSNNIVKGMIDRTADKFPRFLRQTLKQLKIENLDGNVINRSKSMIRYAASQLLLAAGVDCDVNEKELLRSSLINYLRDPRISINRTNWEGVDPKSINIFRQWLSQRDIEFFFEVVSETENFITNVTHWRYRKKFWEAYLPYIDDTWVVMGSTARRIARNLITRQNRSDADFGHLKGAQSNHSVFFIRIKGYDIVEYSHQGATRFWRVNNSPLIFRKHTVNVDDFRRNDTTSLWKLNHFNSEYYYWQRDLENWFRFNLGITPVKSYRI